MDSTNYNENDDECLEFSLCGNDTTLIVREVSVECFPKPTSAEPKPSYVSSAAKTASTLKTHSVTKFLIKSNSDLKSSPAHEIDLLSTKRWSGNTYFEEEIRRLRDKQYEKEKARALSRRKMWKAFQKDILKDKRQALAKSSGPEWWQEPSTKQIVLATTLRDVIKADSEEEVTGRTRQWLMDLGLTARLTPKQVRKSMKRSLLEPVDFLLETHAEVVKVERNTKKKGHLQRPFSVDERLLLSAVCVLQLPTLFTMLHYILPPPKPFPVDNHVRELLYGDIDDETIRYFTPYMEPLPFRNKVDFENWAFGKICSALLPLLLQCSQTDHKKSVASRRVSELITSEVKLSLRVDSHEHHDRTTSPTIPLLISYCLSVKKMTDSLRGNIDEASLRGRTFGRKLTSTAKVRGKKSTLTVSTPKGESTHLNAASSLDNKSSTTTQEYAVSSRPATIQKMDSVLTVHQYQYTAHHAYSPDPAYYDSNMYGYAYSEYSETPKETVTRTQSRRFGEEEPKPAVDAMSFVTNKSVETGFTDVTNVDDRERFGSMDQLEKVLKEIQALPPKEQLHKALKLLEGMGDPLAQLPKVEKLPSIQRWLELRRGTNRILSKKTKDDLLDLSRTMWKTVSLNYSTKGPRVQMTKREERKLTWDRKKWLATQVRKETQKYQTRIKEEKVDNARAFFPTMMNHYDHGSKLNRKFRDVYYTYFPARAADTFVYRPWQPQETTNSK